MERVKSYSWVLTVIMGIAITVAVRELATLIAAPPDPNHQPVLASLVRFGIFFALCIRWTLGTLWYLDKAYISNKNFGAITAGYFVDFFVLLTNFLVFVPLALTVTAPAIPASLLAQWLNDTLLGGKQVSTFIWILVLLLLYDLLWFTAKSLWWLLIGRISWFRSWRGDPPRRIHAFWTVLNFLTLLLCAVIFLGYGFLGKDLQGAEVWILIVISLASGIDIWATIVEDSPYSQWLSP